MRPILVLMILLAAAPSAVSADPVDFERQIAPTLVRRCTGCHNASDPAGGLDMSRAELVRKGGDSGEPAIVSGDPAKSNLLVRIRAGEMPPEGKGPPPTAEEVAALETWVAGGAAWPESRVLSPFEFTTDVRAGRDWWSLVPPQPVVIPQVADAARVRTPIDALVAARLEKSGLSLSAEADRATLIRRATLDLVGLPAPEEIERFVADTSPDSYERLIDQLLASPRYGERSARHWLDVVRFGESNGYETNTARTNAWPYRDWVIQAFNEDLDYRQFITAQLAGDQQGTDAATGFLVGGAHDAVSSPDVELTAQQRMNDLDDMITTTSGASWGFRSVARNVTITSSTPSRSATITICRPSSPACNTPSASCHARQRAARATAAANARTVRRRQTSGRTTLDARSAARTACSSARRSSARPRATGAQRGPIRPPDGAVRPLYRARHQQPGTVPRRVGGLCRRRAGGKPGAGLQGRRATASSVYADGANSLHKLQHVNDGRHGNAHSWISAEPGGGWVLVELAQTAKVDRVIWARDREGKFKDRLPTAYRIDCSADGESWQTVANGEDRRPATVESDSGEAFATRGCPRRSSPS